MSRQGHGDDLAAALAARLAAELAPDVVAGAVNDARTEAQDLLRRHLVREILRQATGLLDDRPEPDARPEPNARPGADDRPKADDRPGADHRPGPEPVRLPEPGLETDSGTETGLYVYGIVAGDPVEIGGMTGIDAAPVSTVAAGDLVAVASHLAHAGPSWGMAEDGSVDVEQLAPRAAEHERVVEAVAEQRPTLPMRFGVLYRSEEAVREALDVHRDELRSALAFVEGRDEWGLSVTWDPAARAPAGVAANGDSVGEAPGRSGGRGYLAGRAADLAESRRLVERGTALADELHAAASSEAAAGVVHAAGAAAERHGLLLRASYLVDRPARDRFRSAIERQLEAGAGMGLGGELTGPWPAYNFARFDLSEAR